MSFWLITEKKKKKKNAVKAADSFSVSLFLIFIDRISG